MICGTDFSAAAAAVEHEKRLVILDPLFWYWHEIPRLPRGRLLWLCVNFPGVRTRIARLPAPERRGLLLVSLGGTASPVERDPCLLTINLSGWYNPVRTFDGYSRILLEALLPVLEHCYGPRAPFRRVSICGNPAGVPDWQAALGQRGLRLATLGHREMQAQIARSGLFLTTPGLNASLEAFRHGTCVAWLPPQNDSQMLQLLEYQRAGLAECATDWYSLAGRPYHGRTGDQARDITDMIRCAEGGRRAHVVNGLTRALERILGMGARERARLVERQAAFHRGLCRGGTLALDQVAESAAWRDVFGGWA